MCNFRLKLGTLLADKQELLKINFELTELFIDKVNIAKSEKVVKTR